MATAAVATTRPRLWSMAPVDEGERRDQTGPAAVERVCSDQAVRACWCWLWSCDLWSLPRKSSIQRRWRCSVISPEIEGVESGTWKAVRKAREKAASWGGSRARMRSCRVAIVTGSRAASLAGLVVPIEAPFAAACGLVMAAGVVECLVPLLPCP